MAAVCYVRFRGVMQTSNSGNWMSGAGLVGCDDNNIVASRPDVVPTRAVQKMILIDMFDPGH